VSIWRSSPAGTLPSMVRKRRNPRSAATLVLETCAAQAPAGLGDVGFNITGSDTPHGVACFFRVLEETLRGTPAAGNGGGSESAYFAQVIRILFAQTRGQRSCCRLSAIHDQTSGGQISLKCVHGSCTARIELHESLPAIVESRVAQVRKLVDAAAA